MIIMGCPAWGKINMAAVSAKRSMVRRELLQVGEVKFQGENRRTFFRMLGLSYLPRRVVPATCIFESISVEF